MKKTYFIAPGFKLEGRGLEFGTPSPNLSALTLQIQPGDGQVIVDALHSSSAHATADGGAFQVFRHSDGTLDWVLRTPTWESYVIVQEPLATALLAVLRSL